MRTSTVNLFAAIALAGCATTSTHNAPLQEAVGDSGYRLSDTPLGENNSESLFVVLAFSGGGTRAAAFSYGALEQLRDTEINWEGQRRRLLDEVDVISSVSGGSLPAAYFGLYGDGIFDSFADEVLYRNIQGDVMKRMFAPSNMFRLFSRRFGRTDILAKLLTDEIFEKKTFADFIDRNKRPFVIINSTDIALGARFEFTQQQFDFLNSDLASYPIGYAVAASAAHPGFLTPVTLRNYPKGPDFEAPDWIAEELRRDDPSRIRYPLFRDYQSYLKTDSRYVHLVDGGISDNLGLLPVIQFAGAALPDESIQIDSEQVAVEKFVIILVNAKLPRNSDYNATRKMVNIFKILIASGEKPVANFAALETAYLRTYIRTLTERQRIREEVAKITGERKITEDLPELDVPDTNYYFIEVAFDTLSDDQEKDYLNTIPTAFKLEREQVDRLRQAAKTILDTHPDFQTLLEDLR